MKKVTFIRRFLFSLFFSHRSFGRRTVFSLSLSRILSPGDNDDRRRDKRRRRWRRRFKGSQIANQDDAHIHTSAAEHGFKGVLYYTTVFIIIIIFFIPSIFFPVRRQYLLVRLPRAPVCGVAMMTSSPIFRID